MAPQKRKRLHDEAPQPPRRATRSHPEEPERQLRSGRVRAGASDKAAPMRVDVPVVKSTKGDAPNIARKAGRPPTKQQTTRRVSRADIQPEVKDSEDELGSEEKGHDTSVKTLSRSPAAPPKAPVRPTADSPLPQTRLVPPPPKSSLQHPPQQPPRPMHNAPVDKISTPKRPPSSADKSQKPPPTPRSDRNIDKVVLGNICFKAWYPSYYGKEVLGDISNTSNNAGGKDKEGGGKIGGRIGGGKRNPPPMLDRLYVCPCCFKYSRELVMWWEHVRCCEKTFEMPGRKVYTHPKGSRTVKVPVVSEVSEKGKGRGRKKSDAGANVPQIVEEVVHDEGEWSVWEVDGEKDRLFCQNLSLFAKLFLDNKSVFFDVTGFNYFLLVYTPPPQPPSDAQAPPSNSLTDAAQPQSPTVANATTTHQSLTPVSRPQVVGFFSKEKLSWDNNNLACILVFPPWQRKGLGALLMGVSYEISRREGILGGPEKPISELGRKGYKRFWAGEIARWLLSLDVPSSTDAEEEGYGEGERNNNGGETLITIEQFSKATWIVPEDCLAVLREMGVVEDAGLGSAETAAEASERHGSRVSEEDGEAEVKEVKTVPRVRLDKEAVRRWVRANRIELTRTCDPEGFIEGYAIKESEGEEVDEG
ncbi:acyl-CoA N-acyltransferase [Hypoxylon sp. NC0597]|nr:acyl-CoA N-acyltransferase [Hypoxylon sp. NC0597]